MKPQSFIIIALKMLLCATNSYSQIGIGTNSPNPSSIVDISSTTKGILTPRMTTAQRTNISFPANGLLVYDTNIHLFYYYNGSNWLAMTDSGGSSSAPVRNNYKLIKSEADLADELTNGGNTHYLLNTDTLYEINGKVTISYPIILNDAFLTGSDANEDMLEYDNNTTSEGLFFEDELSTQGSNGIIKKLTLTKTAATAAKIFDLLSLPTNRDITIRDCIITDFGSSSNTIDVGSINGYRKVYINNVKFIGTVSGFSFSNVDNLFLSALMWDASNTGTHITLNESFGTVAIQGGYYHVDASSTANAIDVTNVTSVTNGNISNAHFYGGGTYINGVSTYTGYNFSNTWFVDCPAIPVETDDHAFAECYYNNPSGEPVDFNNTGAFKTIPRDPITSVTGHLLRFSQNGMVLTYEGETTRRFNIKAKMSVASETNGDAATYAFYLGKNAVELEDTVVYQTTTNAGVYKTVTITASIELAKNDTVQILSRRTNTNGGSMMLISNMQLTAY